MNKPIAMSPTAIITQIRWTLIGYGDWRCDGLTLRGTRCKFRACWGFSRGGPVDMSNPDHRSCKIHLKTTRWW